MPRISEPPSGDSNRMASPARFGVAGIEQAPRPEEAADMVGAEGWFRKIAYCSLLDG